MAEEETPSPMLDPKERELLEQLERLNKMLEQDNRAVTMEQLSRSPDRSSNQEMQAAVSSGGDSSQLTPTPQPQHPAVAAASAAGAAGRTNSTGSLPSNSSPRGAAVSTAAMNTSTVSSSSAGTPANEPAVGDAVNNTSATNNNNNNSNNVTTTATTTTSSSAPSTTASSAAASNSTSTSNLLAATPSASVSSSSTAATSAPTAAAEDSISVHNVSITNNANSSLMDVSMLDETFSTPVNLDSWGEALTNWDTFAKKNVKKLTEMVYEGIPTPLRSAVWQLLAKTRAGIPALNPLASVSPGSNDTVPNYVQLLQQPSPHEKSIRRDIARTYPNHAQFSDVDGPGQEVLFNVIKAYSLYDTEVGYCQGSPFIVGLLLMHMPEDEAFYTFTIIMRDFKLRGMFKPSMADLPVRLFQLEGLLEEKFPDLAAHFKEIGISASMYASQWFLTLFGNTLPLPLVFRIFDMFMLEGTLAVFRAAMTILTLSSSFLLRNNFEEVMRHLSKSGLQERHSERMDEFMRELLATKIPLKKLDKLEKDYCKLKQQEQEREDALTVAQAEIVKLREENKEMKKKVIYVCVCVCVIYVQGFFFSPFFFFFCFLGL